MRNRETKKLLEGFIKLYYIKKIRKYSRVEVTSVNEYLSSNWYEQDNIILRVGRETKENPTFSWKILNRRDMRGKLKYLPR